MRLTISSLIAATAAALVAAQPMTPGLPGDSRNIHPRAPQTNAKRFAAGLPPLPPRSRHSRVPYGGSKVDAARRAVASPSPQVNTACNILVKKASDGSPLGYITASGTIGAYYGPVQSARIGSLEVSFSYQLNGASRASQLDMLPARGLSDGYYSATYPYIGATLSTSTNPDLNPGVSTFAYITATEKTPQGSPPTSVGSLFNRASGGKGLSESAIWQYNPTTQAIAAQWVNSDTSLPTTYLAHTGSALFLTGDMSLLKQKYSAAVEVTFTCDPTIVSSPVN